LGAAAGHFGGAAGFGLPDAGYLGGLQRAMVLIAPQQRFQAQW